MRFTTGFALAVSVFALGIRPTLATEVAPVAAASAKTLNERLIDAARDGRADEVEALLRAGAKVDARSDTFSTPLILAASTGQVEIVQALLKAGADVNAADSGNNETALMYAARRGNIPLVHILLDAKAQVNAKDAVGDTALHFAARRGRIEVMELLLAAGADPTAQDSRFLGTPLHHAAIGGQPDAVRCLLKHGCPANLRDENGDTPLHLAVIGRSNDVIIASVIKALLDAGADINEPDSTDGQTPLMWAAEDAKRAGALQFLIQSHADLNKTDGQGWTALMRARHAGNDEAVKILKQAGGEDHTNLSFAAANGDLVAVQSLLARQGVDHPKQKELDDALCLAVQNPQHGIVKELLTHGANPNARLNGDYTPLTAACRHGDVEIARQLLAAGVNVNQPREFGITPLMLAAENMPVEFVNELIAKGADVNATSERFGSVAGWAARGGKLENMKALVQHGAKIDVHVGEPDGYIGWPLIAAIRQGNVVLVDYLLTHGADIKTKGNHGKTLVMYAVQHNQVDVAKFLIARGADVSARADYDYNNTALELAENTGKTEIAALLRILAFDSDHPDDPRHWGKKLARALAESTQAQIDNRPPDNAALLALIREIVAAADAAPAMKADARYLAAMADLETLKASGSTTNSAVRAAVEAAIAELKTNHPGDARAAMVQQQLQAMLESSAGTPIELKFQAVDGAAVDLAKLRGKVVLVDFWATWCGPCRAEVPKVVAAYNQLHKDGFEVIGISLDQNKEQLVRVTKEAGMTWPQYFDGKGWENQISSRYGIQGIPTMWLVDKKGFKRPTEVNSENLVAQVRKLLAE